MVYADGAKIRQSGGSRMRTTRVTGYVDISVSGMYDRLQETGKAKLSAGNWAVNEISGWSQGEWVHPIIVHAVLEQGLFEKKGDRIVITDLGKNQSLNEK